jgi:hypothetical protein
MKTMIKAGLRSLAALAIFFITLTVAHGQTPAQTDVLTISPLKDQMKYIEEKTRIYENFRAVREDMFQKLIKNVSDTLSASEKKIFILNSRTSDLNTTIDSLRSGMRTIKTSLDEMTRTKNRIRMFGIEVNKITYNTIASLIIGGLIAVLAIGFIAFKRNVITTSLTKKELQDLKNEFEAYKKSSRETREKMSMDHFNEIRKLKGG